MKRRDFSVLVGGVALGMLLNTGGCNSASNSTSVGLQVGKLAPEIVGQDLDSVNFKLSDYRGKVVVVDFWAGW